ncbi:uncharacterized protein BCR38DRAFT_419749 [Pseudomassariella vexata]|uniref:Uncharacterized protein n=1 Tax=Pseudomassariella vexata TaxID=1141098 RepID=A0A1Y2EEC0_9PEZI|nr:uncharacterized protein BCR38DRAFT_419749 [Pseudomassariella vexata]ORY69664.1 hypothetical protein BCR38DRAFT_419749 [Pseudomassariella vexata]
MDSALSMTTSVLFGLGTQTCFYTRGEEELSAVQAPSLLPVKHESLAVFEHHNLKAGELGRYPKPPDWNTPRQLPISGAPTQIRLPRLIHFHLDSPNSRPSSPNLIAAGRK